MWNRRVKDFYRSCISRPTDYADFINPISNPYLEYLRLQSNEIGIQDYISRLLNSPEPSDLRDIELSFF
jgi:hypothetical protein